MNQEVSGKMNHQGKRLPILGITMGDPNGIGPELILKAFTQFNLFKHFVPIVFGNLNALNFYRKRFQIKDFPLQHATELKKISQKKVNFIETDPSFQKVEPGHTSLAAGKTAYNAILLAAKLLQRGKLDAVVTLPINKKTIYHETNFPYRGHTEFFAHYFKAQDSLMLMVHEQLRVALVTVHVPIQEVPKLLSKETIFQKIQLFHRSLRMDFGIHSPTIAVLGLNPHAGENGLIGNEELLHIIPAIEKANEQGIRVVGPFPSDGFFAARQFQQFDGILAIYHDQGLIPFKYISGAAGVNFTAGLPIIRTSPDHGTAYDIAGKGVADVTSFLNAIYLALDILKKRNDFQEFPSPLQKQSIDQHVSRLLGHSKVSGEEADEPVDASIIEKDISENEPLG
jgi:4-hydroxythreonine-4-phosphate dehydrogenase